MGLIKVINRTLIKMRHNLSKKSKIKNKKIVITGSNSGIGLELTKELVNDNVVISITNENSNEINKIKNNNLQILGQNLEIDDFPEDFISEIKKFKPNIVINCAATFGPKEQNFIKLESQKFNKILNVNFFSPLKISQYAFLGEHLNQVVNISSEMGSISRNKKGGFYYYRLSKTILNSFSKNLALELKQNNINVFCIHPGSVKTKMNSSGLMSAEVSAQKIINIISKNDAALSGEFLNINGYTIKW